MKSFKRFAAGALILLLLASVIGGAWLYRYIASGGLRARQQPSRLETWAAQKLVQWSVPAEAQGSKNPLPENALAAHVAAGRELYQKNCDVCHGFDGRGKTAASSGLYPPPVDLSALALTERKRTNGELFYFIRYGIRNTAMPGWQLPDDQIWQLVTYIRNLPKTAEVEPGARPLDWARRATHVGSAACKNCHASIYERWIKTPMANVVRDPREHPDAFLADFSRSDPLVKFTTNDVALIYGSRWKQRYFTRIDNDYYVLPAQWDVTHKKWRAYFVKDDWWAPLYPPDNMKRPTSALCDGCHSVNFNIQNNTVTEWNVGCERCHGPGSEHVARPGSGNIVNPARETYVAWNDVCIQCHSQGRPLKNPMEGKNFDWPVGFDVTRQLKDFWKLEDHRLGETTFTHFPDGAAHKNRMQGNDYVTSRMYARGVTCSSCHDSHGTDHPASLRKPAAELCLDCHGPGSPNGPHAASLEKHTHHPKGSTGSSCVECHMPKIAQTLGDVNVRSHTFHFVTPAETDSLKIPNACNACHTDKSTGWATAALREWDNGSPWRLAPN